MSRGRRRTELGSWIEADLSMLGRIGGEATSRRSSTDSAAGMIAATALEHDLTVITRNVRDFGL